MMASSNKENRNTIICGIESVTIYDQKNRTIRGRLGFMGDIFRIFQGMIIAMTASNKSDDGNKYAIRFKLFDTADGLLFGEFFIE